MRTLSHNFRYCTYRKALLLRVSSLVIGDVVLGAVDGLDAILEKIVDQLSKLRMIIVRCLS